MISICITVAITITIAHTHVHLVSMHIFAMRQRGWNMSIRVRESPMKSGRFIVIYRSVEPIVMLLQMQWYMMSILVIVSVRRGVQMLCVRIRRMAMRDEGGMGKVWRLCC